MKKRLMASLLALCLLVGLLPTAVLAAVDEPGKEPVPVCADATRQAIPMDGTPTISGTCGAEGNEDSVTWKLTQNNDNETYTLTISGSGAMADYNYTTNLSPWVVACGRILQRTLCASTRKQGLAAPLSHYPPVRYL